MYIESALPPNLIFRACKCMCVRVNGSVMLPGKKMLYIADSNYPAFKTKE